MTDTTSEAAIASFNTSRIFYGLPPVAEIPRDRPTLTVVPT